MSATPVREAMLDLAKEGLVEPVRNRGFRIVIVDDEALDEISELRRLLEVPAMGLVIARATDEDLAALEEKVRAIEGAAEVPDVADEALLVASDGTVLEGPTCSIFWVRDGRLRTPALSTGILASITREVVLKRMTVTEAVYPLEDLLAAEEAFLASTARLAQPIAAIGQTVLPAAPGELTKRAQAALEDAIVGTGA